MFGVSKTGRSLAAALQDQLRDGDLVFIAVPIQPFRLVARITGGWVNHVGVAFRNEHGAWEVHEATVPWSRRSSLQRFLSRSEAGRVAVRRLQRPLDPEELARMRRATLSRMGRPYHFGFDLDGRRQFCSKLVWEAYREALGMEIGRTQRFADLVNENPGHPLGFWRLWFFGRIPMQRRTVTPESLYRDEKLETVFEQ